MGAWQAGSVRANGVELHYTRAGSGEKPPLLLLHGLTDYGRYWSRTARALEDQFDVIMPDQRGHGLSSRPEQGYSAEEMAEDAAAFIGALGIAPVTVLGHSMGGAVALTLAAEHPDHLSRLLLLDPPLRLSLQGAADEAEQRERMEQWRLDILAEQGLSIEERVRHCIEQRRAWTVEDCRHAAESHGLVYPEAIPQFQMRQFWQHLFPRITCPTLLIYGDAELGSIVDHGVAAEVASLAGNLQFAHIPGAGHSPQREQFEKYITAVRSFLAEAAPDRD
jgi:N-formylmaleamate deformylase